ncbi:MAG: family N-acetyltransferase [Herminiimonas sp.]|nr:family N-acetyltransferase [Herminiimonas sp.]
MSAHWVGKDGSIVRIYEGVVPEFAWSLLGSLYGSLYSSRAWLRHHGDEEGAGAAVLWRSGAVVAILLFRRGAGSVGVINEGMTVQSRDLDTFAECFFAMPNAPDVISLHAIAKTWVPSNRPQLHAFCSEDFVIDLPSSEDAYLRALGPATRKNLRRHRNRLQREHPSAVFRVVPGAQAADWQIRGIIALNAARMRTKNVVPAIDETETQRLIGMVHDCGEVGLLTIGNRICGGTVFFRFGEDVASRVIAHDPAYDTYRLGTLCCYLTICHCIERGAKRFHLMEGHAQYKLDLLGQYRRLYHTVIYRSFWPMLRNAPEALRISANGWLLQANRWLLTKLDRDDTLPWRMARRARRIWRARQGGFLEKA